MAAAVARPLVRPASRPPGRPTGRMSGQPEGCRFARSAHIPRRPRIVGTDVHTYDAFPRSPYQSHIPAMRTAHDPVPASATPIYDALCSEYRRLFRTLPGDRTGEENLRFNGFQPWQPDEQRPATATAYGRHRGMMPAALPPAQRDNRMGL